MNRVQRDFCLSLAEAHLALSGLLFQYKSRPVSSFSGVVHVTNAWWDTAQHVMVPRELMSVEDFPLFLLETVKGEEKQFSQDTDRHTDRFATISDEVILEEFTEWVSKNSTTHSEWISYVELMGLVQSYLRYHRGVLWGASPTREKSIGSYYRRVYTLHPWHQVYCPVGWEAQRPYVHLLQWMLDRNEKDGQVLWEKHRALHPFSPSIREDGQPEFSALDVCAQSGFVSDLLLKAGANDLLSVDAVSHSLGCVEETVQQHLADRRSGGGKRQIRVLHSPLLPPTDLLHPLQTSSTGTTESVFESAASRRRRNARLQGQALGLEEEQSGRQQGVGPFDLLYYHPPLPSPTPCTVVTGGPKKNGVWWRTLGREKHIPFAVAPIAATGATNHPHLSFDSLRQLVEALRMDVMQRRVTVPHDWEGPPIPRALLKEDGYCVFVLPRTFDMDAVLYNDREQQSLSDFVLSQLEGLYDVILRKRYPSGQLLNSPLQNIGSLLGVTPSPMDAELERLYTRQLWVDVLVVRKNAAAVRQAWPAVDHPYGVSPAKKASKTPEPDDVYQGVHWRDSFEYNEYKPQSLPRTRHHWTDLVPSYSYLENTFYDNKDAVQGNFIAVGHPPHIDKRNVASLEEEKQGVTAELRGKRRTKLRKLALSPLQQQEWYIDEKIIRSEAAKVEFMNELSRWDLQDYDK